MSNLWRKLAVLGCCCVAAQAAADLDDLASLVADGRWRAARAIVDQRESAAGTNNDTRFLVLAAKVRFAYGDLDKTAALAEKAAALDPRCADCQYLLFEAYGSQAQRASLLRQPGLARKCKRAVDQAVALDPKHAEALTGLMMYLYQAPGLFGGDKERARAIPGEVAKFHPARGHMVRAQLAALEKSGGNAVREHYRAAVAADPNYAPARLALAASLSRAEPLELADAEKHAREAVRLRPRSPAAWETLAFALGRQGKGAEAGAMFAELRKTLPDEYGAHYRAAEGLIAAGKELPRAEELLKLFLSQPPQGPERPSRANAEWRLGQVYEMTGRKQEAIAQLETAARSNPGNQEIQRALKRLRG